VPYGIRDVRMSVCGQTPPREACQLQVLQDQDLQMFSVEGEFKVQIRYHGFAKNRTISLTCPNQSKVIIADFQPEKDCTLIRK
jgi:hypothetical protein